MHIAAVVCEYNPFHNGHLYQLECARRILDCDALVGIMSGNFVQRGEAALFPKGLRAQAALACGLDLVLELPAVLTLQTAERYAENAVATLDALGCVDTLVFGTECEDAAPLEPIAALLAEEPTAFRAALRAELDQGRSFGTAREHAVALCLGEDAASLLQTPNNILALEYLKALKRLNSPIRPAAIRRLGPGYHDSKPAEGLASATAIRRLILQGEGYSSLVPPAAEALYRHTTPSSFWPLEQAQLAHLCLTSARELCQVPNVREGLENKLKQCAATAQNLEDLLSGVKSKRYAYSSLRRAVLCAYLGITQTDTAVRPCYIRILDFNETGREVLNHARHTATLPLAKHAGQIKHIPEALVLWQRELALDRVYELLCRKNI